ncbi:MAG TPA: Spy/CpxP family protein refolding chaperone [Beijerinckiaceae bacterium]|jgi:zinc resistance-associated protein
MKRTMIALAAATVLAAGAMAQDRGGFDRGGFDGRDRFARGDADFGRGPGGFGRGMMGRFSPEDVEAFTDARIAALHAGLKLSADQERLWPPVEEAIRGLVKLRREQFRARREAREQGGLDRDRDDLPGMLRGMAERQGARAEALRRLADAAQPLYATFDDGQKRRLRLLARHMRPGGGMMRHAWREGGWRGGMRGGMDGPGFGDRGFSRDGMDGRRP